MVGESGTLGGMLLLWDTLGGTLFSWATLGSVSSANTNCCGVLVRGGSSTSGYLGGVVAGVCGICRGVACIIGASTLGGVGCFTWV